MNLFRVLVLVVALVAGGIAAYLTLNSPQPAVETPIAAAPEIDTTEVLVVSGDIAPGSRQCHSAAHVMGFPNRRR